MQVKVKLGGYDHWKTVTVVGRPLTCGCGPTLEELVCEALREQEGIRDDEPDPDILLMRKVTERREVGVTTVRIVEINRHYGGPEEGGWWFQREELIREIVVPTTRLGSAMARMIGFCQRANEGLGSAADGRVTVRVGPYEGQPRPHYC